MMGGWHEQKLDAPLLCIIVPVYPNKPYTVGFLLVIGLQLGIRVCGVVFFVPPKLGFVNPKRKQIFPNRKQTFPKKPCVDCKEVWENWVRPTAKRKDYYDYNKKDKSQKQRAQNKALHRRYTDQCTTREKTVSQGKVGCKVG